MQEEFEFAHVGVAEPAINRPQVHTHLSQESLQNSSVKHTTSDSSRHSLTETSKLTFNDLKMNAHASDTHAAHVSGGADVPVHQMTPGQALQALLRASNYHVRSQMPDLTMGRQMVIGTPAQASIGDNVTYAALQSSTARPPAAAHPSAPSVQMAAPSNISNAASQPVSHPNAPLSSSSALSFASFLDRGK